MSEVSPQRGSTSSNELAVTQVVAQSDYSKEEQDIAFAAEVLDAAFVTERQLASALANWTLHGSTPLAEHLFQLGLIDQAVRVELEDRALSRLKELGEDGSAMGGEKRRTGSLTKTFLDELDESGRVVKLLGISVAVSGIEVDENETRQHTSRYQLIRRLGQGGLGTVWLARDENLQRYVALKEIKNINAASSAALSRFRREAEITGRLEHPGIVPVYQLGEDTSSRQAFYAMRFLGKQTLQDAITEYHERRDEGDDDPMLLRRLLTAFVSVCQAIGHAHSRKVIHRDLKPENVAIDSFGQVIVIDWGLAKVLDDGLLTDSMLDPGITDVGDGQRTLDGQVLGSPLYMAPEQAAGRVDEINEATDIFGLGAILFAILTGNAPHEQSRGVSGKTTTRQLITAIASGSTPRARSTNEDVDPVLDAICAKAMAKRRYARYSSTTEFAEDIQRWMAGEPVTVYTERLSQRISRWIQHHRRLSQLIAALLMVTVVSVATMAIAARQNYLTAQQTRFEEFRSDGREIEVQLVSLVDNVSRDVRFMSTLPPIQGIIDAQSGVEGSEDEVVWRTRLETIYEGLLRANPEYVTVTYMSAIDEQPREVVRVERTATDRGFVRRIPVSRLASPELSSLLSAVINSEPGDVIISLDERLTVSRRDVSRRRLVAAVPIYDENSGDVFGVVAIETDVISQIITILDELNHRLGEIYVTDATGEILVSSDPETGVEAEAPGQSITEDFSSTASLFEKQSRQRFLTDGTSLIAHRIQFVPTDPDCSLGIVQMLMTAD